VFGKQQREDMEGQTPHEGLWGFLRKRGVAEGNILQMQQDKVIPRDCHGKNAYSISLGNDYVTFG